MTKQGEYKLNFAKHEISGRLVYRCSCWDGTTTTFHIAELLSALSNQLPEELLAEIDNALSGKDFEEYFSFDVDPVSCKITRSHCVINEETELPLEEFRMLLMEWIAFCKK